MATTSDLVRCAVADFLGCWEVQGEATLSLTTKDGNTTLAFTTSLGHHDTPLRPAAAPAAPPAPPTPCRRRRRGPARQERDRARVARHQATLALRRDQENQVRNNPTPSETGEEGGGEEESTHPPPSGLPDTTLPPSTAQEWSSDTLGEGVGVRLTRTPTIPQFDGAEDSFTFSTTNTNTNTSSTASQTLWTIPRNYWSMIEKSTTYTADEKT